MIDLKKLISKTDTIFWLFIFPLGAFLRLYRLGHFSLWYDEGASIQLSKLVDKKFSFLSPLLNNEPPANPVLTFIWLSFLDKIRFWEKYTEWDDFAIRLLPCTWSILSIIIFYRVSKKILKESLSAVILSTLIFAISPFQVYYAQELRIYSFYVLINLIGLYFLLRILENNLWRDWIGLGCTFVILMYSHYFSVWIIFTTNLFLLIIMTLNRRDLFRKWFWTNLVAGILVLPAVYLAWFFVEIVLSNVKHQWYPDPTIKTGLITWKNFFAGYTDRSWAYWSIFLISICSFALGLLKLKKENSLYILFMAVIPILINIIYWNLKDLCFYEHRLFIYSGVVGIIGLGNGLALIKPKYLKWGISIVFLILTLICICDYYNGRLHPMETHRLGVFEKPDFRSLSKYIRENYSKEDNIIGCHSFSMPSMQHYLADYSKFVIALSYKQTQIFIGYLGNPTLLEYHGFLPVPINHAIKGQKNLLFVHSTGISFEDNIFTDYLKKYLSENGKILEEVNFKGLSLSAYKLEQKANIKDLSSNQP